MSNSAFNNLTYGLFVLSARDGDKDNGCIINTATQLTSSPSVISIAVNKNNLTRDMILNTEKFNLSVLDKTVPFEIFKRFGYQSGKTVDKLDGFSDFERTPDGLFYLKKHTNAVLNCEVTSSRELSTHTLFIAYVNTAAVLSDEDSVTYSYYFENIKPAPEKTEKKGYRCKVCGYVYEGGELPENFQCPICGHGAEDFEKI